MPALLGCASGTLTPLLVPSFCNWDERVQAGMFRADEGNEAERVGVGKTYLPGFDRDF